MSKIGIEINDVIRDFISQLEYTYNKYIDGPDINIEKNPVRSFNLIEHFPFDNIGELNKFLYHDAALEIFGHADEVEHNLINRLNLFVMDMRDLYGHEVILISREVMRAIPATLFFLSKTACMVETIKFSQTHEALWDGVDVLITANPETLKCQPTGKVSVKVNRTYNIESNSDYNINSLLDFMTNDILREKIITTKLIN